MSKTLRNLVFIVLFLAPSSSFGMNPQVKIQTSDEAEFYIELQVAKTSETLKHMIEDIGEEAEQSIPLPEISKKQFELLLLPAMQKFAELPMAELKASEEEKLSQQLQQIVADLKSNGQPLDNQQLIEFISGANYLNIPIVEPALKTLAQRVLNKNEWLQLESLGDKLRDLWQLHTARELAKKLVQKGLSLRHPNVNDVIVSVDGKNIISRSSLGIKIWNKTNPTAEPIILKHPGVKGVIESLDGKNLISWGGSIKIWNKNNLEEEPITLQHAGVYEVRESLYGKNLISWNWNDVIIKIWDTNNITAEPITLEHWCVYDVIESSDGYFISSGGSTIKVWDKNNLAEPITLQHLEVKGFIESSDANKLISWSRFEGTIKVWNKNNLAELITLEHPHVDDVIESLDRKNFISWSMAAGTIKVWDKNNLLAEPTTLPHPGVDKVRESLDGKNLISWACFKDIIKIWDKNNLVEPTTLQHPQVDDVIESSDGNYLISWSMLGTIKIWDKNNLAKPITLRHPDVRRVIESLNGKNLISWTRLKGTIKVWDKNNLDAGPITLRHPDLLFIESKDGDLISWSYEKGTITIWALGLLNPIPEQILLLLAVYFVSEGNQEFELPAAKLSELKATFNTLSPIAQTILERQAPHFIAAIKSA